MFFFTLWKDKIQQQQITAEQNDTFDHMTGTKKKIYIVSDLSVNILWAGNKSPIKRGFFKNSAGNKLPALRFLGGLYNFVILKLDFP